MLSFDEQYLRAIKNILENGHTINNERTGHEIKALPGITIDIENELPILTLRKIPLKIFIAETIWYLSGNPSPEFIKKFTKIWDDFTEDDGTIPAAYGYRWRHHFKRDQLADAIVHLQKEPGTRQTVIITWDPQDDGLGTGTKKKNIPCTYTAWALNIMGGKLHFHNLCRSNDMILGCPHDVAGAALLQRFIAAKLGVLPGKLTHSISNAHVYDNQYESARELIKRTNDHPKMELTLTADDFDRAVNLDETLVDEIFHKIKPQYHPLEPLEKTKIVL